MIVDNNMENNGGEMMSIIALVISAGGIMLGVVNHKRIRSNCCGKKLEASLDVENTTPTKPNEIKITTETTSGQ